MDYPCRILTGLRTEYVYQQERPFLASGSLKYTITDWLNVSGRVKLDKETINSEKKMYASTLNVIAENSDKGAYVQSNKNTQSDICGCHVEYQ